MQGFAKGGDFMYWSFTDSLVKTTLAGTVKCQCEMRDGHLGDCDYYNGKIYAPVEGGDEVYACIVVFDAETLNATGEVYDLPNELDEDGVPWCAVDKETGYLYASKWSNAEKIFVYDIRIRK
mgnify:CR=1 FL=1